MQFESRPSFSEVYWTAIHFKNNLRKNGDALATSKTMETPKVLYFFIEAVHIDRLHLEIFVGRSEIRLTTWDGAKTL